jgi:hypothetical protein
MKPLFLCVRFSNRSLPLLPSQLLERYEQDRFVRPSAVSPGVLVDFDRLVWSLLPDHYAAVELSPLCPLGTNASVATSVQFLIAPPRLSSRAPVKKSCFSSWPAKALLCGAASRPNRSRQAHWQFFDRCSSCDGGPGRAVAHARKGGLSMKRLLVLTSLLVAIGLAGCQSNLAPGPPLQTPSPLLLGATLTPDTWTILKRRPLYLPVMAQDASCPLAAGRQVNPSLGAALGEGPLYLVGLGEQGTVKVPVGRRDGEDYVLLALLTAAPGFQNRALLRGRQLNGSMDVRFSASDDPAPPTFWQITPESAGMAGGWLTWNIYLRVHGPGCYGVQIDGPDFSEMIVFQVVNS